MGALLNLYGKQKLLVPWREFAPYGSQAMCVNISQVQM